MNERKERDRGTNRVNVEVTEQDIARAIVSDSYKCVVAQAIARTIPDSTKIEVDVQTIRFTRQGTQKRYVYLTPFQVQGYVVAFDAGDCIEPFKFQLRNPIIAKRRVLAPTKPIEPVPLVVPKADKVEATVIDSIPLAVPLSRQTTEGVKAPPRTFKKKSRSYGMRILRYNQQRNTGQS